MPASTDTKYLCDCWYAVACCYLGAEDKSKEYGRKHKYFRHYCTSGGIYNNQLCRHCYTGNSRLVPRTRQPRKNSIVQVWKQSRYMGDVN